jgi:hypothetical protein
MNLAQCLTKHLSSWAGVLPQQRSPERTTALGLGILYGVGERTLTRAIGFHGNTQKDWSADHTVFSPSFAVWGRIGLSSSEVGLMASDLH